MATSSKIKTLPYGESDFELIRTENKYYVDKTMFIPALETYSYQFFLRPRRFGKSLMLNMLAAYYDVANKDRFQELFGDLAIGKNPTKLHNSYMILKFNFSKIDPEKEDVQKSFDKYVMFVLNAFVDKYKNLLPQAAIEAERNADNSNDAFTGLTDNLYSCEYRIYVLIDEYDNFANTLLADSEKTYAKLTHGDGFFRLFFNNLKAATTENNAPVAKIMISGVTPLTLSDVTSGFNIGLNISMDYTFNSLVGFTETEMRQMLEYYRDTTGIFKHSIDQLIELTKPWYDNNCFSSRALEQDRMFNSDMALYFLHNYIKNNGEIPESMVDYNVTTDYNKMVKLIRFEKQFGQKTSLIQRITTEGQIYTNIKPEFSLENLTRYENLVSLMYYMGLLSIARYERGRVLLKIPNATVRQQFFDYMSRVYDNLVSWKIDENVMSDLGYSFAWNGEHEPFMRYVANCMTDISDNRDFGPQGEAFVKGFILGQFGTNLNYYLAYSEHVEGHGYSDIFLEPRLGAPHAYVFEIKYCKPNSNKSEIDRQLKEARVQLPKYINTKNLTTKAKDGGWTLHGIILVFNGWKLVKYEEVMEI